jgi:hypothetical protein
MTDLYFLFFYSIVLNRKWKFAKKSCKKEKKGREIRRERRKQRRKK